MKNEVSVFSLFLIEKQACLNYISTTKKNIKAWLVDVDIYNKN